jgi:hypothetical protein
MKQIITTLIDDLDQTEAHDVQTVRFAVDKAEYEIDLSEDNRLAFTEALAPFVTAARIIKKPGSGKKRKGDERLTKIREWAKGQGIKLGDRGRIPKEVIKAYEVGHAD